MSKNPASIRTLSLGAGRQSTALFILGCEGKVLPKLDAAVFADTQWEPRHVMTHLANLQQFGEEHGVPVYLASKGSLPNDVLDPRVFATIPSWTKPKPWEMVPVEFGPCPACAAAQITYATDGFLWVDEAETCPDCDGTRQVPARWEKRLRRKGEPGRIKRQCTPKYKIEVIDSQVRVLLGARTWDEPCRYCGSAGERVAPWDPEAGIGPCSICRGTGVRRRVGPAPKGAVSEQWIGFSLDEELDRVTTAGFPRYETPRFPLCEIRWTVEDCESFLAERDWQAEKSACKGCLAYETPVVTPDGAKPIGSLVNESGVGKATLLIPRPRSGWASWREVEVRSFGVQQLFRITLHRGRSAKTVYATAEHRWKTRNRKNGCWSDFVTTLDLKVGDVLPISRAQPPWNGRSPAIPSPFGIAAGFTFGDGSRPEGSYRLNGAASVNFYEGKDEPMLRFFPNCEQTARVGTHGERLIHIYGLPRSWKEPPPLNEARGYLLGWLAGYFAADGTVSAEGQASLFSARRSNLSFVRDVCYILGVQTSPVREKVHPAKGGMATLYTLSINARHLPGSFWLMPHHAERIAKRLKATSERLGGWAVAAVEPTGRREEVFCAVVPGEEMFVLADNIATGNCPFHEDDIWIDMKRRDPEDFADAVAFDRAHREAPGLNVERYLHESREPLDVAVEKAERRMAVRGVRLPMWGSAPRKQPRGCSPYGCKAGEAVA